MKKQEIGLDKFTCSAYIHSCSICFWILKSPFESNAIKIEIQNGSTGEIVELDNSQRDQLIQKLNSLETHVSGISGFQLDMSIK